MSTIPEQIEHRSVVTMESSIPGEMTLERWRELKRRRRAPGPIICEHRCDTTTRYDHREKLLTFVLSCTECGTENIVERLRYEPRFEPTDAPQWQVRRAA
jgi:hypothetical protein